MNNSLILSLPMIAPSQAQKHVTHNEAIRLLDILVQLSVQSRSISTPPVAPNEGDRYIISDDASEDWATHEQDIAVFENGGWIFITPQTGWRADVIDTGHEARFNGSQWEVQTATATDPSSLGINASADTTNRFSISSDASLFNHENGSHQLKINKSSLSDSATMLFQSNWSGRAELGLAGNDEFTIKTSADGSNWNQTLIATGNGDVGLGKYPSCKLDIDGVMRLKPHTIAELPAASTLGQGAVSFVSDAPGGSMPVFSNGVNWLSFAGAVIV